MKHIQIRNQRGVIGFWEEHGKYTVNLALPETIDEMCTCIVPDAGMIPAELRHPGQQVFLTAVVTEGAPGLPPPALGGQKVFLVLQIDAINAVKPIL